MFSLVHTHKQISIVKKNSQTRENFYDEVQSAINTIKSNEDLIVGADFIAKNRI